jgi:hypothetical protein
VARTKIDPAISRKAYADATKQLKLTYAAEFARYLDAAYIELGVESPRQRRERKAQEQAEAVLLRKQKVAARMAKKIEEARALLEAEGITVLDNSEVLAN